jgi:hypothetical protein
MRMRHARAIGGFLNFPEGSQPLVDCGFVAWARLSTPAELWKSLDPATRKRRAADLHSARAIISVLRSGSPNLQKFRK